MTSEVSWLSLICLHLKKVFPSYDKNDWSAENAQMCGYGKKGLSLHVLETPPLELVQCLHTHAIALLCTGVHDACETKSWHFNLHSRPEKC